MPSPSMNGMIGSAGTWSTPSFMVIVSPPVGGVRFLYSGMVEVVMAMIQWSRGVSLGVVVRLSKLPGRR
jgi:hypothetical protein